MSVNGGGSLEDELSERGLNEQRNGPKSAADADNRLPIPFQ